MILDSGLLFLSHLVQPIENYTHSNYCMCNCICKYMIQKSNSSKKISTLNREGYWYVLGTPCFAAPININILSNCMISDGNNFGSCM